MAYITVNNKYFFDLRFTINILFIETIFQKSYNLKITNGVVIMIVLI